MSHGRGEMALGVNPLLTLVSEPPSLRVMKIRIAQKRRTVVVWGGQPQVWVSGNNEFDSPRGFPSVSGKQVGGTRVVASRFSIYGIGWFLRFGKRRRDRDRYRLAHSDGQSQRTDSRHHN